MDDDRGGRVWLTWEIQRRNRTASSAFGAQLWEIVSPRTGFLRYVEATYRTLRALFREKPSVVFAQNPSLVLTYVVISYGVICRVPVVIDAHNVAIEQTTDSNRVVRWLARGAFRYATLTLVSNSGLASGVEAIGGRPAVLPDPLPEFTPESLGRSPGLNGAFNVVFICSWARDEPYHEVIRAGELLPPDVHIYITGKSGEKEAFADCLPQNVTLTGFVPEGEFIALLHAADLIMDLTTREDCLVCGAYEGVAASTPLILSDTMALREYFSLGALYTDNSREDIAHKIMVARSSYHDLQSGVDRLKNELPIRWYHCFEKVEAAVVFWEHSDVEKPEKQ